MATPHPDRDALAAELEAARPRLDAREQYLAVVLYRLLAKGEPVAPERLARAAGASAVEVRRLLHDQPGVYLDDDGAVIGFWGMTISPTPHRVGLEDGSVFAWCALDALFLPKLIGAPARVESRCPVTGEAITLEVAPDGIGDLSPATAVISFLHLDRPFGYDTIESFCHFVHFFVSPEAAREWTTAHPGTFAIGIADAFEIGGRITRATFGDGLDALAAGHEDAA